MDSSPSSRFTVNFNEVMSIIGDIIDDLNNLHLCEFTKDNVEMVRNIINCFGHDNVMYALAKCHTEWIKVKSRQVTFISEDFTSILQANSIPINTAILTTVFNVYNEIKNTDKWKSVEDDKLPVNSDDVENIWTYFDSLIKITCSWVHESRMPEIKGGKLTYRNPGFMDEIDLSRYESLFGFKITDVLPVTENSK